MLKNTINVINVSNSATIIEDSVPMLNKVGINKKELIIAIINPTATDVSTIPNSWRLINHWIIRNVFKLLQKIAITVNGKYSFKTAKSPNIGDGIKINSK